MYIKLQFCKRIIKCLKSVNPFTLQLIKPPKEYFTVKMSNKVILVCAIFAMVSVTLVMSKDGKILGDRAALEKIREAVIQQDVQIGMNRQGRLFLSNGLFGNLFNFSGIIGSAPLDQPSLTFMPLATILFAKNPNRTSLL